MFFFKLQLDFFFYWALSNLTSLYSPWNSPGQNTGVGSLSLLVQGNLPNTGIEPRSPALQVDSLPTELSGKSTSKRVTTWFFLLSTVRFNISVEKGEEWSSVGFHRNYYMPFPIFIKPWFFLVNMHSLFAIVLESTSHEDTIKRGKRGFKEKKLH